MEIETEEAILKSIEFSGYKGIMNIQKKDKNGTLILPLGGETFIVVINVKPAQELKDLTPIFASEKK